MNLWLTIFEEVSLDTSLPEETAVGHIERLHNVRGRGKKTAHACSLSAQLLMRYGPVNTFHGQRLLLMQHSGPG